jgi:hypothetical protein
VGRQVIQWGESLFIPGITTAQAPMDLTAATAPGTEVKEILLPSAAAYVQLGLTKSISLAGYYQFEWYKNRYYESGSYFSVRDMLDEAGTTIILAPGILELSKKPDQEPDPGEFGVALTYVVEPLHDTEFGLYYVNYHEHSFSMEMVPAAGSYYLTFANNVELIGASFSSQIFNANVSGEIAYRMGVKAAIDGGMTNAEADYLQGQVSWIWLLGPNPLMDNISFYGEIAFIDVMKLDVDLGRLAYDDWAWGYNLRLSPSWYHVIRGLDIALPIDFAGRPNGSSFNGVLLEKAESVGVGLEFTYKYEYKLSVKYVNYFHEENSRSDRDYIAVDVKYTF